MVELPRSFEFEFAGVTLCGDARVFRADSDMDMLCDIAATSPAVGVATSDAPAPLSWERQETDHGRALLPPRFFLSCTCVEVTAQAGVMVQNYVTIYIAWEFCRLDVNNVILNKHTHT